VLIAPPDLLPVLERHVRVGSSELISITDAEPLRALEIITTRRPDVIALERLFAATPRGAALISRVKADPSLSHAEIRVVAHDEEPPALPPAKGAADPVPANTGGETHAATPGARPLDLQGTRRARRFRIAGQPDVLVDGSQASLVDLSVVGAQVVSASVLRPNQRVRLSINDEQGTIRCTAVVAWAKFEIPPKSGPRYRAGLDFFTPDATAIDAYCSRHREADA
jgi:hypothetical protein